MFASKQLNKAEVSWKWQSIWHKWWKAHKAHRQCQRSHTYSQPVENHPHMSRPIVGYVYRHFDLLLVGFFIKTSPKFDSWRENEENVGEIWWAKGTFEDSRRPVAQLIMNSKDCGVIKNYPSRRRGVSFLQRTQLTLLLSKVQRVARNGGEIHLF